MASASVLYDTANGIGTIRLNRPDVHNAINSEMISRLQETLDQLDRDKNVRVLILTSAQPGMFCAGGDLKYFAELKTPDEALAMCRRMKAVLNRLENGPQVVIAAIDGAVHGGACEMILSCHFRIATPDSKFSFRHAARGLSTVWGGAARLFRLVPHSPALRLLLTAAEISAADAFAMGLIDELADPAAVVQSAETLARSVMPNSSRAIEVFLQLAAVDDASISARDKLEEECLAACWDPEEFRRTLATLGSPDERK